MPGHQKAMQSPHEESKTAQLAKSCICSKTGGLGSRSALLTAG